MIGKKTKDVEPGYIFVPYIIQTNTTIILEDNLEEIKNEVIQENRALWTRLIKIWDYVELNSFLISHTDGCLNRNIVTVNLIF